MLYLLFAVINLHLMSGDRGILDVLQGVVSTVSRWEFLVSSFAR
jgi:hypothetical protein